jgi:hypothetical protein
MHGSKPMPEACHCAVMLAAVVGHDAGGKLTRSHSLPLI